MALSEAEIKCLAEKAQTLEESAKGDNAIANLKEALRCYDKILTHCPDVAYYYCKRGGLTFRLVQSFGGAGDSYLSSAIADIGKAIELEPDKGDYYRIRGLYRLQWLRVRPDKGMSREEAMLAMQDLKACISRDPAQPLVWLHLLVINLVMGAWDEAISVYGQCKPYIHTPDHVLMRSYFGCLALAFAGDVIEEEDLAPLQDETASLKWITLVDSSGPTIGQLVRAEKVEAKKNRAKEVIRLLIRNEDNWFSKGWYFDELLGDAEQAIEAYDKAIESGQSIAAAWANKGWIYQKLTRYEEALDAYNKAAQLEPDRVHTLHNKAKLLEHLGRYEDALHAVDQILAKEPGSTSLWVDKSFYLGELGEHREALAACRKAHEIDPSNAVAWGNMAFNLRLMGRFQESLECSEKALEYDPDSCKAWNNKGQALHHLNCVEKALQCYERAIQLDPNDASAWTNKGWAQGSMNQPEAALDSLEQALHLDPELAVAWMNMGATLARLDRPTESLKAYDKALQLDPRVPLSWMGKGLVLQLLDRSEEALECYDKALELEPNPNKRFRKAAILWVEKAAEFHDRNEHNDALEACKKALKFDASYPMAWNNKGVALKALNAVDEALACYDKALELDSEEPLAWYNKGLSIEGQNRFREALRCYDRALYTNPDFMPAKQSKARLKSSGASPMRFLRKMLGAK